MNKYFKIAAAIVLLFQCFILQSYGKNEDIMIQTAAKQISFQEKEWILSKEPHCKNETIKQNFLNQDTFYVPIYVYGYYWDKFSEGGTPEDIINYYRQFSYRAKTYAAINSEGSFILLDVSTDDSTPQIWKRPESDGKLEFLQTILVADPTLHVNDQVFQVTNLYCFDMTTSRDAFIIYYETDHGVYVEVWEDEWSTESKIYSQADFTKYAKAYNDYITAPENNYDENGLGLSGGHKTFLEIVNDVDNGTYNRIEPRNKSNINTPSLIWIIPAVLVLAGAVRTGIKKLKSNHV